MNIIVSGYGRMGQQLVDIINENEQYQLQAIVDYEGINGYQTISEVNEKADVMIDFSHPSVVFDLLQYATRNQVPLVLATTNYSEEQKHAIIEASKQVPIFHTSNTSYGVQVLLQAVKMVQNLLPEADIEVVETHHKNKVDAPSGTAHMIVSELSNEQTIQTNGRVGESLREENEIGIHSIRGGSVAGIHEVRFYINGEHLTVTHHAESKDVFVYGALRAAQYLLTCDNGYYNMSDMIKEYLV